MATLGKKPKYWVGSIDFMPEDKSHLEGLGVEFMDAGKMADPKHTNALTANVKVPNETFGKLNEFWGRYFWSLMPEGEESK